MPPQPCGERNSQPLLREAPDLSNITEGVLKQCVRLNLGQCGDGVGLLPVRQDTVSDVGDGQTNGPRALPPILHDVKCSGRSDDT